MNKRITTIQLKTYGKDIFVCIHRTDGKRWSKAFYDFTYEFGDILSKLTKNKEWNYIPNFATGWHEWRRL